MRGHLGVALVVASAATSTIGFTAPAGAIVGAGERVCPEAVGGEPGDVVVANLTPVGASGPGSGQLISSSVATPPVASNVNFGPGTVDPNVAVAPIGSDRRVCFTMRPPRPLHRIRRSPEHTLRRRRRHARRRTHLAGALRLRVPR